MAKILVEKGIPSDSIILGFTEPILREENTLIRGIANNS